MQQEKFEPHSHCFSLSEWDEDIFTAENAQATSRGATMLLSLPENCADDKLKQADWSGDLFASSIHTYQESQYLPRNGEAKNQDRQSLVSREQSWLE